MVMIIPKLSVEDGKIIVEALARLNISWTGNKCLIKEKNGAKVNISESLSIRFFVNKLQLTTLQ